MRLFQREGGIGKSTLAAKIFDECLGFVGKCWIDVRAGTSIIEVAERSLLQELSISEKYGLRRYRLQPRIQDFARKKAGDLTIAHQRAIYYYWENRRLEFQPNEDYEAASEYLETFYHEFILGRYEDAAKTIFACDEFLSRRGYNQLLIDSYQSLYNNWKPTAEQYEVYSSLCINLGVAYNSLGEYQRAIDYYQQSLTSTQKIGDGLRPTRGDRNGEAISLGNLGNVYNSLGEYQRAIDYHEQSLTIKKDIGDGLRPTRGDRNGEAISLYNKALSLKKLNRRANALECFKQALIIYADLKLEHDVETCKTQISQFQKSRFLQLLDFLRTFPLWFYVIIGLVVVLIIWWIKK